MAREITTEELLHRLHSGEERFFLIDTLPRESYAHRHLPGAISLPLEELGGRALRLLDQKAEIVAYCSGPR
ncbi:MAG TPA: rhodanese-like domain-containing protein [Myxococcales bacterium]|jgi:rhodanese-related sulfurtransferase